MKCVIIGCGWLGLPLAKHLIKKGVHVIGTTRNVDKLKILDSEGIPSFVYNENDLIPVEYFDTDFVILNFPPSASLDYAQQIQQLIEQFSHSTYFIFTSSTGVYGEQNGILAESDTVNEDHTVRKAEIALRNSGRSHTILRLSGLIGEDRHPIHHLSGRTLENGQHPVNLVHRTDVMRAIDAVILNAPEGMIYNVCYPDHPNRKEYYTSKALEKRLIPPSFIQGNSQGKVIDGSLICRELNFIYLEPI